MLVWSDDELDRLSSALVRARDGLPTVLVIEGDPGQGKTALLRELVSRAGGFQVLHSDGIDHAPPYTALMQWGVDPPRPVDGGQPSPVIAAQALRDQLDGHAVAGPVLLLVDDLQWADPESVEAVLWLLRRSVAERLLLAVGSRPLPAQRHHGWQRWIAGQDTVLRITLAGRTAEQVATLARHRWPAMSDEMAARLHEHTGGNPLYLTALLAENDPAELSRAQMLPAPTAFAATLAEQITQHCEPAVRLLRAASVLGPGWISLALVGVVAGIEQPEACADELVDDGLIQLRVGGGPAQLRVAHALIGAAVYQQIPLGELRELHARAASVVTPRSAALRHRIAAAAQYDEALADEIETAAAELYGQRTFRQAAQLLRWASALTRDPAVRERRWLQSVFDTVLSHDYLAAHAEADDVRSAGDVAWRALVLGLLATLERRYRDAVRELEPIAVPRSDETECRARYLIEVLLAWARLCLGHPTELIAAGLARAGSAQVQDAGVSGFEMVTASQIAIRTQGVGPILQRLSALPAAAAVPLPATGALAFRGSVQAVLGLIPEAGDDLGEATRRITSGVLDLGAGSFHAYLGFVQWLCGDWARARVSIHQAAELGGSFRHQMTVAMAPLVDVGTGRFAEADAAIAQARELLTETPWYEACRLFLGTLLARIHAGGTPAEKATALAGLRGTPFEIADITTATPTLLLNYVPALIWAKRLDEAQQAVGRLNEITPQAPWVPAVCAWFDGLIREGRGDGPGALARLRSAIASPGFDLPLYRAHLYADHARLALLLGSPAADASLGRAEEMYRQLGAKPYLERVLAIRVGGPEAVPRPSFSLTEREQDVLTLLITGMSYAQISRELFITQSTVGYHLGNIYGKVGVTSRHELTAIARKNPQAFGITIGLA